VDRRDRYAAVRSEKAGLLANTREDRHALEEHVHALEREQSAILARLQGPSGSGVAGPIRQGSGSLIWPLSGPVTSGFGYRWGRLHAGIDIAVGVGTAIRAADGGRVAIAGWLGGYGNYTCIQHGGSLSTCYGHQSGIGVSVGQSVSQGQVIGSSGNTGNSTGPHLHFETRVNGNPVDPMGYL
jgi:murein DD-endopeptidase MepM/ murein hydrolase activator NlpD